MTSYGKTRGLKLPPPLMSIHKTKRVRLKWGWVTGGGNGYKIWICKKRGERGI